MKIPQKSYPVVFVQLHSLVTIRREICGDILKRVIQRIAPLDLEKHVNFASKSSEDRMCGVNMSGGCIEQMRLGLESHILDRCISGVSQ